MKTLADYRSIAMQKYFHYKIQKRKVFEQKDENGAFLSVRSFQKPVTCKGPKLYAVRSSEGVFYIGITTQSISNRLRYGFTATGTHGYHGYKWKGHKGKLDILIWCFPNKTTQSVESIEAEVVFRIRNITGFWPTFQTEIHFHKATKEEALIAEQICKIILKNGKISNGQTVK